KEPAALAIVEAGPNKPALVFLATGKEDAAEVKRVMIAAEKYFDGRKAKKTVQQELGSEVTTYEIAAAAGTETAVCVYIAKGNLFAATNSAAAARKLLKLWEAGDKDSLLLDVDFTKIDAQSRKLAEKKSVDARWFVRPLTLARLLQPKPEKRARGKNWVEIAGRQGVDAVTGIGGVVSLQPNKSHDLEVASLVVAKRPFAKGLRLAEFKPGHPVEPPDWVEAEVGSYISWSWDLLAALDGAGNWLDEKMNDKGLLNAVLADLALNKGVDLRLDVLSRMGPGMFAVSDSHRTKDPSNPSGLRMLIGVQSKEQQKLAKKMPGLTRDEPKKIKDEVVAGSPLRHAPDGEPLFTEPDPMAGKNTRLIQAY
ncbi:MAG TPA: hypothetical protein VFW62_08060, partial [bacterium]|nr:hypothetical protein [bacterium]